MKKHCPVKRGGYNQLSVNKLAKFSLPAIIDVNSPKIKALKENVTKLLEANKELAEIQDTISFSNVPAEIQMQDIGKSGFIESTQLPKKIKGVTIESNKILLEPNGFI